MSVVAVDVGGTTIKGAVFDAAGRLLRELTRPTPVGDGPEAVIGAIVACVGELIAAATRGPAGADQSARAVSIVVPGIVDSAAGRAEFSANLGLRGVPMRDILSAATGLPVVVEHDVRAAGVAERTLGVASGVATHLLAVIGTGIAGVTVIDGLPVHGAANAAGELGHVPIWPDGELCPCGQRGCLERYASGAAIARRYVALRDAGAAASTGGGGRPGAGRGTDGTGLGARDVAARRLSEPAAAQAWAEAAEALGIALATCTMLLDPALIVLAGGLSLAGETLLEPVRAALAARVRWREPPPAVLSTLGGRAGLLGAAVLGWRLLGLDDFAAWPGEWRPSAPA